MCFIFQFGGLSPPFRVSLLSVVVNMAYFL